MQLELCIYLLLKKDGLNNGCKLVGEMIYRGDKPKTAIDLLAPIIDWGIPEARPRTSSCWWVLT